MARRLVAGPAARGEVRDPVRTFTAAEVAAYEEAIAIVGCSMVIFQVYFWRLLLDCPYTLF